MRAQCNPVCFSCPNSDSVLTCLSECGADIGACGCLLIATLLLYRLTLIVRGSTHKRPQFGADTLCVKCPQF